MTPHTAVHASTKLRTRSVTYEGSVLANSARYLDEEDSTGGKENLQRVPFTPKPLGPVAQWIDETCGENWSYTADCLLYRDLTQHEAKSSAYIKINFARLKGKHIKQELKRASELRPDSSMYKQEEFLSQIIPLNELFDTYGGLTDKHRLTYANTVTNGIRESTRAMKQIANNSSKQAMIGDLPGV